MKLAVHKRQLITECLFFSVGLLAIIYIFYVRYTIFFSLKSLCYLVLVMMMMHKTIKNICLLAKGYVAELNDQGVIIFSSDYLTPWNFNRFIAWHDIISIEVLILPKRKLPCIMFTLKKNNSNDMHTFFRKILFYIKKLSYYERKNQVLLTNFDMPSEQALELITSFWKQYR